MGTFLAIIAFWLVVFWLDAHELTNTNSPTWDNLAKKYRAKNEIRGKRFNLTSFTRDYWVEKSTFDVDSYFDFNYSVVIGDEGIHISAHPWMRIFHPPFFIPWSDIDDVSVGTSRLAPYYVTVSLAGYDSRLVFWGKCAAYLLGFYNKRHARSV